MSEKLFITYLSLALFAGMQRWSLGSYKDTAGEPYNPTAVVTSLSGSLFWGIVLMVFRVPETNTFVYVCMTISLVTITGELHKLFIRKRPRNPELVCEMSFCWKGVRVVGWPKWTVMCSGLGILGFMTIFLSRLHGLHADSIIGISAFAGLLEAMTGALKDVSSQPSGQAERFDLVKFIRSPLCGFLAGCILSLVGVTNGAITIYAALGLTRTLVEGYKLFRGLGMSSKFAVKTCELSDSALECLSRILGALPWKNARGLAAVFKPVVSERGLVRFPMGAISFPMWWLAIAMIVMQRAG